MEPRNCLEMSEFSQAYDPCMTGCTNSKLPLNVEKKCGLRQKKVLWVIAMSEKVWVILEKVWVTLKFLWIMFKKCGLRSRMCGFCYA